MMQQECESARASRIAADNGSGFAGIYDDIRRMASRRLGREQCSATMPPTALAHEVYLRLARQDDLDQLDRTRRLKLSARILRSVLVDSARRKQAECRQASGSRVELDEVLSTYEEQGLDLVALDDALEQLAERSPELAELVELRFFGGHSMDRVAVELGISVRSAHRNWQMARRWLHDALTRRARR